MALYLIPPFPIFLAHNVNAGGEFGASLWQMPATDGPLQKLADLPGSQQKSVIRRWSAFSAAGAADYVFHTNLVTW